MPRRKPTYREVEVKLPVADMPTLLRALRGIGVAGGQRVLEINTLFDTPQSDLRRAGRLLRVRVESPAPNEAFRGGGHRAILTSKAPAPATGTRQGQSLYKERLERELVIANPSSFQAALRAVGFVAGFRYEKYRTAFHAPGLEVSLDETPVGVFLELEGVPRGIDRFAHALGFSPQEYVRSTYWDLHAADCRRRGVNTGHMLLQM